MPLHNAQPLPDQSAACRFRDGERSIPSNRRRHSLHPLRTTLLPRERLGGVMG